MCFENLALSDRKNVTNSLQIYFVIVKNISKIEQENILIDLKNFIIRLISVSENIIDKMQDDISDNINSEFYFDQILKQLFSAVAEKDSISDFSENITDKMQDNVSYNINSEFYVD